MAGTGNPPPRKTTKAPTRQMWRRSIITLVIIIGFCFTAVVGKMGVLMIAEGEDWQQRAVSQRMSDSITTPSRDVYKRQPMTQSRKLLRVLSANAQDVQVDAQGRILLPKHLLTYASLEKEALVLGAGNRAEIWNPAEYEKDVGDMDADAVEAAFVSLGF